jgi:hypothetical protein
MSLSGIQELWGLCQAMEKRVMVRGAHSPPSLAKGRDGVCPVRSAYCSKHCPLSHKFINIPDFGRRFRELIQAMYVRT